MASIVYFEIKVFYTQLYSVSIEEMFLSVHNRNVRARFEVALFSQVAIFTEH